MAKTLECYRGRCLFGSDALNALAERRYRFTALTIYISFLIFCCALDFPSDGTSIAACVILDGSTGPHIEADAHTYDDRRIVTRIWELLRNYMILFINLYYNLLTLIIVPTIRSNV